eukprot:GHVL01014652.1.p2 GENE.GHVL01014652.1~~GHVL01014652.1.p2  ORF type:complete len:225 (+),score=37.96 GHVL01014652.1:40-714(+)
MNHLGENHRQTWQSTDSFHFPDINNISTDQIHDWENEKPEFKENPINSRRKWNDNSKIIIENRPNIPPKEADKFEDEDVFPICLQRPIPTGCSLQLALSNQTSERLPLKDKPVTFHSKVKSSGYGKAPPPRKLFQPRINKLKKASSSIAALCDKQQRPLKEKKSFSDYKFADKWLVNEGLPAYGKRNEASLGGGTRLVRFTSNSRHVIASGSDGSACTVCTSCQ